jgi:hypothetical protein
LKIRLQLSLISLQKSIVIPFFPVIDPRPQEASYQALKDSYGRIWCNILRKAVLSKVKKKQFSTIIVRDKWYKTDFPMHSKKIIWDDRLMFTTAGFHMSDGIFVFDRNMKTGKINPMPAILKMNNWV